MQPVLRRRFDMAAWFKRHGFPVDAIARQALVDAAAERERHMAEAMRHMHLAAKVRGRSFALPPSLPFFSFPPHPCCARASTPHGD